MSSRNQKWSLPRIARKTFWRPKCVKTLWQCSSKSLRYMLKNIGDNVLPWRKTIVTVKSKDTLCPHLTINNWFLHQYKRRRTIIRCILQLINFDMRWQWLMLSNIQYNKYNRGHMLLKMMAKEKIYHHVIEGVIKHSSNNWRMNYLSISQF